MDVKLLSTKGIEDYFVAASPAQKELAPRKEAGVHIWMASDSPVRGKNNNVRAAGFRKVANTMDYELAFPYTNEDLGDSLWQMGWSYQIAVLVGPTEEFSGVIQDT